MNRLIPSLKFTLFLAAISFSCGPAMAQQNLERPFSAGGTVVVKSQGGPIRITGWDRDNVQATTKDSGRKSSAVLKVVEETGTRLVLVFEEEKPLGRTSHRGTLPELEVQVPRGVALETVTGGGEVMIEKITGTVMAKTGGGDVRVTEVGPLTLKTGGGDIIVQRVTGDASIVTGGGDISVQSVSGTVKTTSGGGDLAVTDIGGFEARTGGGDIAGTKINGSAFAQTGGGDVGFDEIAGNVAVKAISGDVKVTRARGSVDVNVTSGDVIIKNIDGSVTATIVDGEATISCVGGSVEASSASGSIVLKAIGGNVTANSVSGDLTCLDSFKENATYRLKTLSGEIEVRFPESAGFSATLASYSGEVDSDFTIAGETPQAIKSKKRISGQSGQGTTNITLDAFSGNVRLKKSSTPETNECTSPKQKSQ